MTSYKDFFKTDVEKFIIQQFKNKFTSECNAMSSSQNAWVEQNLRIIVPAGVTVRNCSFNVNQNMSLRTSQFCLDIPKLLSSMNQSQKDRLITDIIDSLRNYLSSKLTNRTKFINALCDKLQRELRVVEYIGNINEVKTVKTEMKSSYDDINNKLISYFSDEKERANLLTDPDIRTKLANKGISNPIINNILETINKINANKIKLQQEGDKLRSANVNVSLYNNIVQSCFQKTLVIQDQNLIISKNLECENSNIQLSQDLEIDLQSNCFVKPVLDSVKNDVTLQRLYNEGDIDPRCKYYLEYGKCIDNQRKVTTKIVSPQEQCQNILPEEYLPCEIPKCKISNWSDWSICNFNENGKPTRFRIRKFIKQGEECNNIMKEVEECEIPDRDAGSSLINKNALKYDLYDTYRGNINKNTYIFISLIIIILIIFIVNML
jgi:hypothetical protein